MNDYRKNWITLDLFLKIRSRWFTLFGEHLKDEEGTVHEYWRIEKSDSVIILPILDDHFILPVPIYRPGLGRCTLDFPGGRVPPERLPHQVIPEILERELGIESAHIKKVQPLNKEGWAINSSFSNQRLYGFTADIGLSWGAIYSTELVTYPVSSDGIFSLLGQLSCLQCRAVLLEWYVKNLKGKIT